MCLFRYLEYVRIPHTEPIEHEFRWGQRADMEVSKAKILEFMGEVSTCVCVCVPAVVHEMGQYLMRMFALSSMNRTLRAGLSSTKKPTPSPAPRSPAPAASDNSASVFNFIYFGVTFFFLCFCDCYKALT